MEKLMTAKMKRSSVGKKKKCCGAKHKPEFSDQLSTHTEDLSDREIVPELGFKTKRQHHVDEKRKKQLHQLLNVQRAGATIPNPYLNSAYNTQRSEVQSAEPAPTDAEQRRKFVKSFFKSKEQKKDEMINLLKKQLVPATDYHSQHLIGSGPKAYTGLCKQLQDRKQKFNKDLKDMETYQRSKIVGQINETLNHKHNIRKQKNIRVKLTQCTHQMFCELFDDSVQQNGSRGNQESQSLQSSIQARGGGNKSRLKRDMQTAKNVQQAKAAQELRQHSSRSSLGNQLQNNHVKDKTPMSSPTRALNYRDSARIDTRFFDDLVPTKQGSDTKNEAMNYISNAKFPSKGRIITPEGSPLSRIDPRTTGVNSDLFSDNQLYIKSHERINLQQDINLLSGPNLYSNYDGGPYSGETQPMATLQSNEQGSRSRNSIGTQNSSMNGGFKDQTITSQFQKRSQSMAKVSYLEKFKHLHEARNERMFVYSSKKIRQQEKKDVTSEVSIVRDCGPSAVQATKTRRPLNPAVFQKFQNIVKRLNDQRAERKAQMAKNFPQVRKEHTLVKTMRLALLQNRLKQVDDCNKQIAKQDNAFNRKNMSTKAQARFLMKSDQREQQKQEFVKQLCRMETLENVHNTLKEDFRKNSSLAKQQSLTSQMNKQRPTPHAVDFAKEEESPANFNRTTGNATGDHFALNIHSLTAEKQRNTANSEDSDDLGQQEGQHTKFETDNTESGFGVSSNPAKQPEMQSKQAYNQYFMKKRNGSVALNTQIPSNLGALSGLDVPFKLGAAENPVLKQRQQRYKLQMGFNQKIRSNQQIANTDYLHSNQISMASERLSSASSDKNDKGRPKSCKKYSNGARPFQFHLKDSLAPSSGKVSLNKQALLSYFKNLQSIDSKEAQDKSEISLTEAFEGFKKVNKMLSQDLSQSSNAFNFYVSPKNIKNSIVREHNMQNIHLRNMMLKTEKTDTSAENPGNDSNFRSISKTQILNDSNLISHDTSLIMNQTLPSQIQLIQDSKNKQHFQNQRIQQIDGLQSLQIAEQQLTPFVRGANGMAEYAFETIQNQIMRTPTQIQNELYDTSQSKMAVHGVFSSISYRFGNSRAKSVSKNRPTVKTMLNYIPSSQLKKSICHRRQTTKHEEIYSAYNNQQTFEKFYSMKQKELQQNQINCWKISNYNNDPKEDRSKSAIEHTFQARYGSAVATYYGSNNQQYSQDIYFHGGIGHHPYHAVEVYNPSEKKFYSSNTAFMKCLRKQTTFVEEMEHDKLQQNRVDHSLLLWRDYDQNFMNYVDRLVIYGGQTYQQSVGKQVAGSTNCASGRKGRREREEEESNFPIEQSTQFKNLNQSSQNQLLHMGVGDSESSIAAGPKDSDAKALRIQRAETQGHACNRNGPSIKTIRACIKEICLFDIQTRTWELMDIQSKKAKNEYLPVVEAKPRRNHVACLFNQHMVVYGGIDNFADSLNDVMSLDLKTLKWSELYPLTDPRMLDKSYRGKILPAISRSRACMVLHAQREFQSICSIKDIPQINWRKAVDIIQYEGMYIFGGILPNGNVNEKLYILCVVPVNKTSTHNKLEWMCEDDLQVKPKGKPPQGRYDHGMVKFNNNLVVFGGRKLNKQNPFADSVYLLALDSFTWVKINQSRAASQSQFLRSEFSYVTCQNPISKQKYDEGAMNSYILVFGGMDLNFQISNKVMKIEFYKDDAQEIIHQVKQVNARVKQKQQEDLFD